MREARTREAQVTGRRLSLLASLSAFIFALVGIAGTNGSWANEKYPVIHSGNITRITDGDTVRFQTEKNGKLLKVRMVSIDTPELHFPSPQGVVAQGKWGQLATDYLESILPANAHGQLADYGMDKYGRTLGRVGYRNMDINLKMVEAGMAIPYLLCTGPTCDRDYNVRFDVPKYVKACNEARATGRGIFNRKSPLREMPFEFRNRMRGEQQKYYMGDLRSGALYNPEDYKKVDLCHRIMFITVAEAHRAGYR